MDLVGVQISSILLTSDRDNLVFFLPGFKNESSVYLKLPLEDALVCTLGIDQQLGSRNQMCLKLGVTKYLKNELLEGMNTKGSTISLT